MDVLTSLIGMARKQRRKSASNGRQDHPTGHLSTVDDPWKDEVRAAMHAQSPPWDQKDLAKKVGVSRASITNMFKPGPRQIRFKAKIHEVLGWPSATRVDEVRRRLDAKWMHLSDAERSLVAELVEKLAGKP